MCMKGSFRSDFQASNDLWDMGIIDRDCIPSTMLPISPTSMYEDGLVKWDTSEGHRGKAEGGSNGGQYNIIKASTTRGSKPGRDIKPLSGLSSGSKEF
ncbi:hypothetical protein L7F22_062701 [Adiantum nelumboides]|nr:hypothetical protein [Adiantum nelumboides]